MAKVIGGDYREVIFNASDGFSSSVTLETAMAPNSILALEADGTDLNNVHGFGEDIGLCSHADGDINGLSG